MERSNKFFGLGKTLAAGALALAMVPGSALATATYDAEAFTFLGLEYGADIAGVGAVDLDDPYTETKGNADAVILADSVAANGFSSLQDAWVTGEANPTGGAGSTSFASLDTATSITLTNTGDEEAFVSAVFDYSGSASTWLDDLANEAAGAGVSVLFGVIDFATGAVEDLVNIAITETDDPFEGAINPEFSLSPGQSIGLFVDVSVDGLALSVKEPGQGVPVPATLALLGIGLLGFALRKRLGSARS